MNQPVDPKTIELLKIARNQILTTTANPPEVRDKQESATAPSVSTAQKKAKGSVEILATGQVLNKFGEEFVQKLTSIEREKTAVDEEIAKMEKIWLNLTEKKKELENRRGELIKVKDKLKELDKEMSAVLSKELGN